VRIGIIAIILRISTIISIVGVDLVLGNPHRTKARALLMAALFPPPFRFISIIGSFFTFAVPRCFQALVSDFLVLLFVQL
jgi:hypothetical protein